MMKNTRVGRKQIIIYVLRAPHYKKKPQKKCFSLYFARVWLIPARVALFCCKLNTRIAERAKMLRASREVFANLAIM